MSWIAQCRRAHMCKECHAIIIPSERAWKEPRHFGLMDWGKRGVVDKGGIYCEECGKILEYEGAKK
jgi:RNase P subunit RPR2